MNLFNQTFFKFAFGFLAIIAASFVLINVLSAPLDDSQHTEALRSTSATE